MVNFPRFIWFVIILIVLPACSAYNEESHELNVSDEETTEASIVEIDDSRDMVEVDLKGREGDRVGIAVLTEHNDGVNIQIEVWNLPAGLHGFHIHETGLCEEPSFESAGGHFNPTQTKHGFDHPEGPHLGDLPNLNINEVNRGQASFLAPGLTLKKGEPNSLLPEKGTALVIHADPDDYISQPAGNAGERIACGVIID